MAQSKSERITAILGVRAYLIGMLVLIFGGVIFFMAYSHLPRAGGANSNTTSDLVTPTAVVTKPVSSLTLNRSVMISGVQMTVTQIQQAAGFSNVNSQDGPYTVSQAGPYTIRVYMQAKNSGQAPIGIDFSTQAKLLLPNGRAVSPQVISISPVMMPNTTQTGFFDFPVQKPVSLTALVLRLDMHTVVAFQR